VFEQKLKKKNKCAVIGITKYNPVCEGRRVMFEGSPGLQVHSIFNIKNVFSTT
jgi:hypothetical protein